MHLLLVGGTRIIKSIEENAFNTGGDENIGRIDIPGMQDQSIAEGQWFNQYEALIKDVHFKIWGDRKIEL